MNCHESVHDEELHDNCHNPRYASASRNKMHASKLIFEEPADIWTVRTVAVSIKV